MPNILRKKLNYQRLANKMNQRNGIELIEIIDEQNEFADVYFNSSKLILRASYPIYDSKPYTNDFEDAVKWIFKILEGKISNEWVLALSDCGDWCVHVKVLDLKKAMKDLWWDENAALTLLDVNNNLILAIEVWESNIEVRILYLSSENAPDWVNRFACGKASLQHFEYTNIQRCEAQATISQVLEFESKSGLNLPTSYANFVLQYDGVNVLIHAFDSSNSSEKVNVTFYKFQEILESISQSNDFLDCLLIPFGVSEKYVLCFDYRNSLVDAPAVVLCKQGASLDHGIMILTKSFEDFIDML